MCLGVFGHRNSFSKTDINAAFMHLKDDAMRNRQLKAGYNLQIATENRYVLAFDIFQRPTDQRTLVPFMKTMNWHYAPVRYIVADAGYGSEPNYHYLISHHFVPLVLYGMYEKEHTRKYRRDPTRVINWHYDAKQDKYVDPYGVVFRYLRHGQLKDHTTGFVRQFDYYQAKEYDTPEKFWRSQTRTGRQRRIGINRTWLGMKATVDHLMDHDPGKAVFAWRKDEVETVFGTVKADLGFRRFHLRVLRKVWLEAGIVLLAYDLNKFTNHLNSQN